MDKMSYGVTIVAHAWSKTSPSWHYYWWSDGVVSRSLPEEVVIDGEYSSYRLPVYEKQVEPPPEWNERDFFEKHER